MKTKEFFATQLAAPGTKNSSTLQYSSLEVMPWAQLLRVTVFLFAYSLNEPEGCSLHQKFQLVKFEFNFERSATCAPPPRSYSALVWGCRSKARAALIMNVGIGLRRVRGVSVFRLSFSRRPLLLPRPRTFVPTRPLDIVHRTAGNVDGTAFPISTHQR